MNEKQKMILEQIREIIAREEPMPTVAELGRKFGMSQQAMSKNLKTMEKEGHIERIKGKHRYIQLAEKEPEARKVPLLGKIAAGQPLEPIEDDLFVEVPLSDIPKGDVYCLQVQGDSMIEDGILEGDVILVKRQTSAFNGQTVVAVVNREATLKRYYHEGDRIRLQPANAVLQPFFVMPEDEFEIRGVLCSLYRKYHSGGYARA